MEGLERILSEHPFFRLSPKAIANCSRDARRTIVSTQGSSCSMKATGKRVLPDPAWEDRSWRSSRPAASRSSSRRYRMGKSWARPGSSRLTVGCSTLAPLDLTRAIGMDAACLRGKCEADHHLGYEMMKRFFPILVGRLDATRIQILDALRQAMTRNWGADPFLPELYRVVRSTPEIPDVVTIDIAPVSGVRPPFAAGQFNMLYVFAHGDVSILERDAAPYEELGGGGNAHCSHHEVAVFEIVPNLRISRNSSR